MTSSSSHSARSSRAGAEVVRLDQVSKVYGNGPSQVEALSKVSLTVAGGEFLILSGPSGSGKSTLLNLIGALDRPSSGRVIVAGEDLGVLSRGELARVRRQHIGFIFQAYNLLPALTAVENAEFTLDLLGVARAQRRERALAALARVGVKELAHRLPGQLSGGQQQRVAIARALAASPDLILADEPTASLDSRNAESVLDLIQELNETGAVTFIVSTHDPRVMTRAKRVVHMADGQVMMP